MFTTSFIVGALMANINAQCVYPNLDLSSLAGLTLECPFTVVAPIPDTYILSYSICNNSVHCVNVGAPLKMIIQEAITNPNNCYYLASWDPDIMPVLTNSNPIEYTFTFDNGQTDENCGLRKTDISFICDPTANPVGNITCGETSEPCSYFYKVNTNVVCGVTPSGQCSWNSGGKVLNLTLFAENNVVLSEIDASDSNNVIGLTPCRNGLECTPENIKKLAYKYTDSYIPNNKEGNVMGFLAEIDDLKCLQSLAIWNDGSVEPSYDAEKQLWQFVYEIPNGCDGLTSVFMVYYTCNPNTFYTIESASTVTTCLYQMTIQTYLAC